LGYAPVRGAEVVRMLDDPKRRRASLLVATEAVVQHSLSPIEHRESSSLTSERHVAPAFGDQGVRLGLAAALSSELEGTVRSEGAARCLDRPPDFVDEHR